MHANNHFDKDYDDVELLMILKRMSKLQVTWNWPNDSLAPPSSTPTILENNTMDKKDFLIGADPCTILPSEDVGWVVAGITPKCLVPICFPIDKMPGKFCLVALYSLFRRWLENCLRKKVLMPLALFISTTLSMVLDIGLELLNVLPLFDHLDFMLKLLILVLRNCKAFFLTTNARGKSKAFQVYGPMDRNLVGRNLHPCTSNNGHSITIAGIQVRRQENRVLSTAFLILDPAHERSAIYKNNYLCHIDHGIVVGQEMEQLKKIDSNLSKRAKTEDFPDPLGPTSATFDPASICKLKLWRTVTSGRNG
ncbi:hypothetical protein SADUNF_Sadunf15G0000400 [Salix dunnii]|uniref:Uncharacterized protein n=1 Tax=Salix dunnii TaxID=1413687 RepID=A0A835JHF2_9ROSI|nr:hypothetical protein SADUNF_Sadunf15G0000400 [Salix dunnii]